jgi:hypothetical protein
MAGATKLGARPSGETISNTIGTAIVHYVKIQIGAFAEAMAGAARGD